MTITEEVFNGCTFENPKEAFARAISIGLLSRTEGASNYAGDYMYMGTWGGLMQFKNIITRDYIKEAGL